MPAKKTITPGTRFGRWTLVREARPLYSPDPGGWKLRRVLLRCDCGTEKLVRYDIVARGESRSCGCLKDEEQLARQKIDIPIGKRFGRLTILVEAPSVAEGTRKRRWFRCQCDCGEIAIIPLHGLRNGTSQSCGCLRKERATDATTKHGHARKLNGKSAKSRVYSAWLQMRGRCQNPDHSSFKDYGGRGIKICKRWQKFENFLADMGEPPLGTSLDRLKNDRGYKPSNCEWRTPDEQINNRRTTIFVTYSGERLPLKEWANRTSLPYSTLRNRIVTRGWSARRAFTTPFTPKFYRATRETKHANWLRLKDFAP